MFRLTRALLLLLLLSIPVAGGAQKTAPAFRQVFLDTDGVIRWSDTRDEVLLFGANYAIASSSDYRAAGVAVQAITPWTSPQ